MRPAALALTARRIAQPNLHSAGAAHESHCVRVCSRFVFIEGTFRDQSNFGDCLGEQRRGVDA